MIITVLDRRHEKPSTWYAGSWQEVAERSEIEGQGPGITIWSRAEIEMMDEDGVDFAPEALTIARACGEVAEVQVACNAFRYFAPADAPPLSEVVSDWLLTEHNSLAFEGGEAAKKYLAEYATPAEQRALSEALKALAWVGDESPTVGA